MTDYAAKEQQLKAARRLLAARKAKDSFYEFMRLMLPDTVDPDDVTLSEYKDTKHGRLLCELIERVEAGKAKRFAVSIAPQMGKTWHMSIYGPAWILGRDPRTRLVIASYNETRAEELGADFRKAIMSPAFKQVFPGVELDFGSKSKSAMATTAGGKIFFVGAGGTVTGRTADYFFIDDPIKDDQDVQSATFRENMWKWFFSVAYSRGSKRTRMGVVHTRWNQDDLIGRLCDPDHPERKKRFKGIADDWMYLNISGVIHDERMAKALGIELEPPIDPVVIQAFGERPVAALWEEEKDLRFYAQWKLGEPDTFNSLVMGKPGSEEGDYFKAEWLVEYDLEELPEELEIYGASDHAVSVKQMRDYTVLGCVGVDSSDTIWVLPDVVWDRMKTDRTVEEMILMMKYRQPFYWWMESELISKSFGPFLQKRMEEERVYVPIDEVVVSADKATRARAIQGRLAMKKVRFPRFAPWWADARSQLLMFKPGGNGHDDFVDWLSHIGLGLLKQHRPSAHGEDNVIPISSIGRMLRNIKLRSEREKRQLAVAGW